MDIRLIKLPFSLHFPIVYLVVAPENIFPHLLSVLVSRPKPQSSPLMFCFTCRYSHSDGAKIQESRSRGKSFLPPPIDLDKIHLDEKDHLIADTRCEFDFVNLQSWLKDIFLDQSDEIRL
jgi:hypothetical protein